MIENVQALPMCGIIAETESFQLNRRLQEVDDINVAFNDRRALQATCEAFSVVEKLYRIRVVTGTDPTVPRIISIRIQMEMCT